MRRGSRTRDWTNVAGNEWDANGADVLPDASAVPATCVVDLLTVHSQNRGDEDMLYLKRVYERPEPTDGKRILVDRLWPRGLSRRKADVDEWMKDIAPSTELRRWFRHDPAKWLEFGRRYRKELRAHKPVVDALAKLAARRRVTIVYSARDEVHNDARVLAAVVRRRINRAARAR
jgi:uncharacterized protein YeaO (DUF488 family)